jgi:hypothetical protein
MCPPETLACGPDGLTWDDLTPEEQVAECKRAEDYRATFMGGDREGSVSRSRCDDDPASPDWAAMIINPLILTDDAGEGEVGPSVQTGTPIQDLVGTLPDPGKDGTGGGSGTLPTGGDSIGGGGGGGTPESGMDGPVF